MTAVTDTVRGTAPAHPMGQSVRDPLVVAKRNLIRMSRIPNPVRPCWSGFTSGKESAK